MLILDQAHRPIDRVAPFLWRQVEHSRGTTTIRLGGRPLAYLPHSRRAYYTWLLVLSYRPAQWLSVHQYSPPCVKAVLAGRYEVGLVLAHWLLGMRLGRRLVWMKRTEAAAVRAE